MKYSNFVTKIITNLKSGMPGPMDEETRHYAYYKRLLGHYFLQPSFIRANAVTIENAIRRANSLHHLSDREKMEKLESIIIKYGSKLHEGPMCQITTNFTISASSFDTNYLGFEQPIICRKGDILITIDNGRLASRYGLEGEMPNEFSYVMIISQSRFLEPLLNESDLKELLKLDQVLTKQLMELRISLVRPLSYEQIHDWKLELSYWRQVIFELRLAVLGSHSINWEGDFHSFQHYLFLCQEFINLVQLLNQADFVSPALLDLQEITEAVDKKEWLAHYLPLFKRILEFSNTHLYYGRNLFEEESSKGIQLTYNQIWVRDKRITDLMSFLCSYKALHKEIKGKSAPEFGIVI